jgi:hypothetical protein
LKKHKRNVPKSAWWASKFRWPESQATGSNEKMTKPGLFLPGHKIHFPDIFHANFTPISKIVRILFAKKPV